VGCACRVAVAPCRSHRDCASGLPQFAPSVFLEGCNNSQTVALGVAMWDHDIERIMSTCRNTICRTV
jgi:hypothetical protein